MPYICFFSVITITIIKKFLTDFSFFLFYIHLFLYDFFSIEINNDKCNLIKKNTTTTNYSNSYKYIKSYEYVKVKLKHNSQQTNI